MYCRKLDEGRGKDHGEEMQLSLLWTELSFELDDLELAALAKRCRIKGRYWADPNQYNRRFLDQAQTRLEDVEKAAATLLKRIK